MLDDTVRRIFHVMSRRPSAGRDMLLALTIGFSAPVVPAAEPHALHLLPDTPSVLIETGATERSFIKLPNLDFRLEVTANCPSGMQPEILSLGVADTRVQLGADLLGAAPAIEVAMRVPAGQIAPVAVSGFCNVNPGEGNARIIEAVLSLQGSLLCVGEETHRRIYSSVPLAVALVCADDTRAEQSVVEDEFPAEEL